MKRITWVIWLAAILMVTVPAARSEVITLTDGSSSATVDSTTGMRDWKINGFDILFEQWFWYRIGNAGGESSVGTLNYLGKVQSGPQTVRLDYSDGANFNLQLTYSLLGIGMYSADISEQIRITSIRPVGQGNLDFHFFQYSDFDLGGVGSQDQVRFPNINKAEQKHTSGSLAETSVVRDPSFWEAGPFAGIKNSLNDGNPTTLSNMPGLGVWTAPADMTWAFQWDFVLAPGQSIGWSKNKLAHIVPEPATILLLGGVLLAVGSRLRRKLV